MTSDTPDAAIVRACFIPAELGESPVWSVDEQCLYYVDIAAREVLRLRVADGHLDRWPQAAEPGCIALLQGGRGLLVARRDGLWRLDTHSGAQQCVAEPPYDSSRQRFNDGKPDAHGRFWLGTLDDARAPQAGLYRFEAGRFELMAGGFSNANGLAWSADQRRLYAADTKAHKVYAFDAEPACGALGERRDFAVFSPRAEGQPLAQYGGRPDGAAVDAEGCYWVAMYEGARVLRLSPEGELLEELRLPVRCPTMLTFGGADLRTLFITTARAHRPADELAAEPWAGCVLQIRVAAQGLPAHRVRL